jgi:hypothetical protein
MIRAAHEDRAGRLARRFELFKTSSVYDGTAHNPEWLWRGAGMDPADDASKIRFLHVANGTSTTRLIAAAGIPGELSIWADPRRRG